MAAGRLWMLLIEGRRWGGLETERWEADSPDGELYPEVPDFSTTFVVFRGSAPLDPESAGGAELLLPDRRPRLDRLDPVPAGGERLLAVGRGDRHDDGYVADAEAPEAVADQDVGLGVPRGQLPCDPAQLALGHRLVRLVLQVVDDAPLVVVPHHAHEEGEAAVRVAADGRKERGRVDRLSRQEGHPRMILTP